MSVWRMHSVTMRQGEQVIYQLKIIDSSGSDHGADKDANIENPKIETTNNKKIERIKNSGICLFINVMLSIIIHYNYSTNNKPYETFLTYMKCVCI